MSKDNDSGQESEQSMEDILASIRKIISDDDEPEDEASASSAADDEDETGISGYGDDSDDADDDEDVLVLSDPLPDEAPEPAPVAANIVDDAPPMDDEDPDDGGFLIVEEREEEPAAAEASTGSDADDNEFGLVFEDAPAPETEPEPESEPEPEPEPVQQTIPEPLAAEAATGSTAGLLSPEAAALSASALAALRSGGTVSGEMGVGASNTVEALVAELLKPMLKQWLDVHLPSMVETLVREEIQRIQRQDTD